MYSVYFGKLCHSNAVYINSILTLLFFKVYSWSPEMKKNLTFLIKKPRMIYRLWMSYTDRHAWNHKMKNKSEDRVFKILFPVREKRSSAVSLFPFRQISEFPTGAALLKFRVGIAVWCTLHTVKCLQERSYMIWLRETGWYHGKWSSLCVYAQGDFFSH